MQGIEVWPLKRYQRNSDPYSLRRIMVPLCRAHHVCPIQTPSRLRVHPSAAMSVASVNQERIHWKFKPADIYLGNEDCDWGDPDWGRNRSSVPRKTRRVVEVKVKHHSFRFSMQNRDWSWLTRIGWGNMQMEGQNVSNCIGSFGSEECQRFRHLREGRGSQVQPESLQLAKSSCFFPWGCA